MKWHLHRPSFKTYSCSLKENSAFAVEMSQPLIDVRSTFFQGDPMKTDFHSQSLSFKVEYLHTVITTLPQKCIFGSVCRVG